MQEIIDPIIRIAIKYYVFNIILYFLNNIKYTILSFRKYIIILISNQYNTYLCLELKNNSL